MVSRAPYSIEIVPAPLHSDKDNVPNPEYLLWYRQDQILLSAILESCSETIQPLISSANTAREAWDRLTLSYANSSRSQIISLKSKLAQNSQGTKSIAEFLTEMRSIADELALAQHPMAEDDLIVHILTQLGNEYSPLVAAIKVRDSPISYSELFDKLTDFERTLHDKESAAQPALATVHATQKHFTRPHPANVSFADTPSAHPHYHHRRTKGGRSAYQGRPQSTQINATMFDLFCNFCKIPSHNTQAVQGCFFFAAPQTFRVRNNVSGKEVPPGRDCIMGTFPYEMFHSTLAFGFPNGFEWGVLGSLWRFG
ncbi:hypothetical protein L6164_016928 [Bauhinia variegata]|uniref:Uncharacterized protein n=1 Tax=Bauhinia variegata TaxID=167791 RepID=A0ACB9NBC2_BAUVA|nr:hypothetical protein L6164_016928 [Bauhinia variegata]